MISSQILLTLLTLHPDISKIFEDTLTFNNVYFDNMVSKIYPSDLQLTKANTSDTEGAYSDLHLLSSNDIVSIKFYDKRDNFECEIVNFPFLDGYVYSLYILWMFIIINLYILLGSLSIHLICKSI